MLTDPNDILQALVAVKQVRILYYKRTGPTAEIAIEQIVDKVDCHRCGRRAQVKEFDRGDVTGKGVGSPP